MAETFTIQTDVSVSNGERRISPKTDEIIGIRPRPVLATVTLQNRSAQSFTVVWNENRTLGNSRRYSSQEKEAHLSIRTSEPDSSLVFFLFISDSTLHS